MAGNVITEIVTGPTFGNTTNGSKVFKTVTNIVPDTTVASSQVTIGHVAGTFGKILTNKLEQLQFLLGQLWTVATSLDALSGSLQI